MTAQLREALIFLEGLVSEDWSSERIGKKEQAAKKLAAMHLVVKGWRLVADGPEKDAREFETMVLDTINEVYPYHKQPRGRREGFAMPHTAAVDRAVRASLSEGKSLRKTVKSLPEHQQDAARARVQRHRRKQKALVSRQTKG